MAVYLGNADYSPIKGYSEIQGDMSVVNSSIFITEGKIIKDDDNYIFCMLAKSITDISKADLTKGELPVCFVAHSKEYTRWTKDNPKLPTQPTDLEKSLIEWLEGDGNEWLDKSFKGKLHLNGSSNILQAVREKKFWNMLVEFEECEPDQVKDLQVKGSSGNGKKSSSYSSQTEAQKLNDRVTVMIAQASAYGTGLTDLLSLSASLATIKGDTPEVYEVFMELLQIAIGGK